LFAVLSEGNPGVLFATPRLPGRPIGAYKMAQSMPTIQQPLPHGLPPTCKQTPRRRNCCRCLNCLSRRDRNLAAAPAEALLKHSSLGAEEDPQHRPPEQPVQESPCPVQESPIRVVQMPYQIRPAQNTVHVKARVHNPVGDPARHNAEQSPARPHARARSEPRKKTGPGPPVQNTQAQVQSRAKCPATGSCKASGGLIRISRK